ncbi:MAG: family 78 glycoside hydrolase catalytic domain [Clostridia bacterium]|nr:family 78 glycoside hydrolase catalytic domain [Clostridia bacterium]
MKKNHNENSPKWICGTWGYTEKDFKAQAPYFRGVFYVADDKIAEAILTISGLGYYETSINGVLVTDHLLTPYPSMYDQAVYYDEYDVADFLKSGKNVIGTILGNGWYNDFTSSTWDLDSEPWRDIPKLCVELTITYQDGYVQTVTSGPDWKVSKGPILFDGLRSGEHYDARLELDGWELPEYDDSFFENAAVAVPPGGSFRRSESTPVKVIRTITPTYIQLDEDTYLFDAGESISGVASLKVNGYAGNIITMRYAEKKDSNGYLDASNVDVYITNAPFQTDSYILKGTKDETWHARFCYHGFRYIEIKGLPHPIDNQTIEILVIHNDFEKAGHFACSNQLINQIYDAAMRSTLGNFVHIPTDCPHREKHGWTGDAWLSSQQTLLNFNAAGSYRQWLQLFKDAQKPSGQLPGIIPTSGWGYKWGNGHAFDSSIIFIPWYLYLYKGDKEILKDMYPFMKRTIKLFDHMAVDGILSYGLGDWSPPHGNPDSYTTPLEVTGTAFYYNDLILMSKIADVLELDSESQYYKEKAVDIKRTFTETFVNTVTGEVANNSQTAYALAICFGLLDDSTLKKTGKLLAKNIALHQYHPDCGIFGTKFLLNALTITGNTDAAYRVASSDTFPSWGYMLKHGNQTLWERWDGSQSMNHHMFSSIVDWFFSYLGGVKPVLENPGFEVIDIAIHIPSELESVNCFHECDYGKVVSDWRKSGGKIIHEVTIPPRSNGRVTIPEGYHFDESESELKAVNRQLSLPSGNYTLTYLTI